ncbi:hypothetical protein Ciccas_004174, partial [Cichlidogyrus casuarinus]
ENSPREDLLSRLRGEMSGELREVKIPVLQVSSAKELEPYFLKRHDFQLGEVDSPGHQAREVLLKLVENSPKGFTCSEFLTEVTNSGIAHSEKSLRTLIKQFCVYKHARYFLTGTVHT